MTAACCISSVELKLSIMANGMLPNVNFVLQCHNMTLQNPAEEKKLTHFLDDVKKCAQQLFRSCSTRP